MGEHAAIAALTVNLKAVGDDCAVVPLNDDHDQVLTTDPLICGIHFMPDTPPEQIGWKAAARVLSDIAAMGAEPQYLLINLVAPPEQNFQTLEKIYAGVSRVRKRFGGELIGGDLAQGPNLELHVFGTGLVPKGQALLRSGAQPGDLIYVTGPLGGAQKSGKQFTFEPRIEWGLQLRESGAVTSMMDISDGLATDLRHMLNASGVGAELNSTAIPVGTAVPAVRPSTELRAGGRLGEASLPPEINAALYDGEDFELLFTAPPDAHFQTLGKSVPDFAMIGKITDQSNVLNLDSQPLETKAFEHFR